MPDHRADLNNRGETGEGSRAAAPIAVSIRAHGSEPGGPSPDHGRLHPRSTAKIFGHPIHPMLVPFPIAFFIGAFVTDIIYSRTANLIWQYFSIWLITAGLIMAGLAAVAGFVDYFGDRRVRQTGVATPHMLLNVTAVLLSLLNAFVHSRDGWTAVVPQGLILSGVVTAILLVSAWLGGSLSYRHAVGVTG